MNYQKQIKRWLESKEITQEQADKMLADIEGETKEKRAGKLIVVVSTIGAVLLGIGAILFVASNWKELPDILKVIVFLGSTFGAYCLGYLFKYHKKNLPKVGSVLLFLGALLFGASVMLIAQIYNINANAHWLVLVWLVGVLPLVYAFFSESIAALSAILFYLWITFFIFRDGFFEEEMVLILPVIFFLISMFLSGVGGMHYFEPKLKKIAQVLQSIALKIIMFSLFLLTFKFFSGYIDDAYFYNIALIDMPPSQLKTGIVLVLILAVISLIVNIFFNPSRSKTNLAEYGVALGLVGLTFLFFFFPVASNIYTVIYNLVFAALAISLIFLGYQENNIKMVNRGVFWISLFIFARYFDLFWDLMSRSLFFMVGGLILVLGGIAMEKKRRQIMVDFKKTNS